MTRAAIRGASRPVRRDVTRARRRLAGPPVSRLSGDRGASLAEAALLTPVFVFLIFGVIEMGDTFKDYLTLANVTQVGVRAEVTYGNDASADYQTLQAMKQAATATNTANIVRIVIWKPTSPTSKLTDANCLTGTGDSATTATGGPCNVYFTSDWNQPLSDFDCSSSTPVQDGNWCATTRNVGENPDTGVYPDYLGVYVRFSHPFITGLFGNTRTMTDDVIVRLEPQILASS